MKRKVGCLIFLFIIVGFIALCIILSITFGTGETKNAKQNVVFDAMQYRIENGKNISETALIEKLGQPQKTDEWNYTRSDGRIYKIRTLTYENSEYSFNNDVLHRITLNNTFSYNSKNDFLPMFNLKEYSNTTISDTNSYYRAHNCGVNDVWIEYADGQITMTKISYSPLFE